MRKGRGKLAAEGIAAVIAPVDIVAKARQYNRLHITRSSFCGKENLASLYIQYHELYGGGSSSSSNERTPPPPTAKTRLQPHSGNTTCDDNTRQHHYYLTSGISLFILNIFNMIPISSIWLSYICNCFAFGK